MRTIRVIRKLVIQGPEDWVMQTLSNCVVTPSTPFTARDNACIVEEERYEDVGFRMINDPDSKVIRLQDVKPRE